MRAGQLRHVLLIEQPSRVSDGLGGFTTTWIPFETVRGAAEPFQGREYFAAQQTQSDVNMRWRIRYLDGLTKDMRITCEGRRYDIKSIIDMEERHRVLVIMAVERTEGA